MIAMTNILAVETLRKVSTMDPKTDGHLIMPLVDRALTLLEHCPNCPTGGVCIGQDCKTYHAEARA